MKLLNKFFIPLMAAGILASCSSENFDSPVLPENGAQDGVNMKIAISLPSSGGTRAEAGEYVGEEVGKDFENNVKEVLVVLAHRDNNDFIARSVSTIATDEQQKSPIVSTSTFNKSVLVNYINSLGEDPDQASVNVFVFCNPTEDLKKAMASHTRGDKASSWMDEVYTLSEDNLEYKNVSEGMNIPMANEKNTTLSLPKKSEIENGDYAVNAFDLGTIPVIRSIARFDFKNTIKDGKYPIDITVNGVNGDNLVSGGLEIRLTHMALVNLSKSFYYLHRTLDKNDNTNYAGTDSRDSYIVDADWEWKKANNWEATTGFSNNFMYPLYNNDGDLDVNQWNRIEITDDLNGDDNEDKWNTGNQDEGYKIWRYVTENTIPGAAQAQKTGISTGVVFRGIMNVTDNTPETIRTAMENYEDIYVYNSTTIFGNWDAVETWVNKEGNENLSVTAAYNASIGDDGNVDEKKAVENGFTIYRYDAEHGGYCTLYYYWNRHWDNGNNGVMAPMEFAVVRNNVYKLAVESISALGHPRNPGDDPDPVDPDDPDEKGDVKLKMSVQVLNWTVRKNNIQF
ncbi:MAG: Mfa1 family fimbria major subunit [Muribaculaceae bacterium]|nr:Mfa1 family fimbria major subunit [Muribaculaceae bacterium]